MPELPEVVITARLLDEAVRGLVVESVLVPGVVALKTFDPPPDALVGAALTGVEHRGKLLLVRTDRELTLLVHLMSAGRLQLFDKRASLRDKASRLLVRLEGDRELRLREFGTKQAAWVKLLRDEALEQDEVFDGLAPDAWPTPPDDLRARLKSARPLHAALRDQRVVAGIGRTWVDEILWTARLSPFKRGDQLSDEEFDRLRDAIVSELQRVLDVYEAKLELPLPDKLPKPTQVHAHQGEPCPRCQTVLEAVFYEDYVMSYCPAEQTDGRVLKDRRLSRLLK